ncbi:hypothetical protein [uncultured Microbacterium sp.]|uniref:hypothetical protein n=1 Tax=uncultured Microbacterium sp. TaxID=191216 RepID=UPI00261FCD33|nr:hypothetical protein [uncultured Microbacterium sp.]
MRKLPVLVEPFAGETVSSVYRRLADRNAVPTGELWTSIRHAHPRLPLRTTPELVPRLVEELADLPPGFFDGRSSDRLFVRCIHADWRHSNCPTCAPLPSAVTKCRRCTGGEPVEVHTRTGAVCVRHRRWHYAGADRDLTRSADFIRAERCLTGTLWERGIGPDTGELELATALLRGTDLGQEDESHQTALERHYPEAVRLVALTTEPWAERFLANTNVGPIQVAALVEAAVNAVTTGTSHDVDAVRASFRAEGRETVIGLDRPMRFRCGRSSGLNELGRRILTLAPRVRATLLRHADARRRSARRPRGSSRHARV